MHVFSFDLSMKRHELAKILCSGKVPIAQRLFTLAKLFHIVVSSINKEVLSILGPNILQQESFSIG